MATNSNVLLPCCNTIIYPELMGDIFPDFFGGERGYTCRHCGEKLVITMEPIRTVEYKARLAHESKGNDDNKDKT